MWNLLVSFCKTWLCVCLLWLSFLFRSNFVSRCWKKGINEIKISLSCLLLGLCICFVLRQSSLWSSDWSGTHYIGQAGLELTDILRARLKIAYHHSEPCSYFYSLSHPKWSWIPDPPAFTFQGLESQMCVSKPGLMLLNSLCRPC